jgi:hypothetical protein
MAANKTTLNRMVGYSKEEKECFNFGWEAAMKHAEALKPSHNKQSTPLDEPICDVCGSVLVCPNWQSCIKGNG